MPDTHHEPPSQTQIMGISVRDYFAAKAMEALIIGAAVVTPRAEGIAREIVEVAYRFADAMMEERKKR